MNVLDEFKAMYGVTFTREVFARSAPDAAGRLTLQPSDGDPLPPVGCLVMIYLYGGGSLLTKVVAVDEAAGTYMAQVTERRG